MSRCLRALIVCLALTSTASAGERQPAAPSAFSPQSEGWISGAADDETRFERIERYLRGFDQPMWEVGERYVKIHEALSRGNEELAAYHWEKIRTTIRNGYLKRPARRENADNLFLDPLWEEVRASFGSGEEPRGWRAFERVRAGCQSCHEAEGVAYMNDQPMFDLRAPAARP